MDSLKQESTKTLFVNGERKGIWILVDKKPTLFQLVEMHWETLEDLYKPDNHIIINEEALSRNTNKK